MQTLKPRRLKVGDTVALLSPSAPLAHHSPQRLHRCIDFIQSMGLQVELSAHADSISGYVSASGADRANDLHMLFGQERIAAIISLIGGYHCNQLLPFLDFEYLRKHPKIFVGYSDTTVLQMAIWEQTKMVTFYGPAGLSQFGEYPHPFDFSIAHFRHVLQNGGFIGRLPKSDYYVDECLDWTTRSDEIRPRVTIPGKQRIALRDGEAEGPLLGGCLPSLLHLRGTQYWPDLSNAILLLEMPPTGNATGGDVVSQLDMHLTDLRLSGVFEEIAGLLFGRSCRCTPKEDADVFRLLLSYTSDKPVPVIANFETGHTDPILTLPMGCSAQIRLGAAVDIVESAVSG